MNRLLDRAADFPIPGWPFTNLGIQMLVIALTAGILTRTVALFF